jgi:methionyl-tRNA formyltransferase
VKTVSNLLNAQVALCGIQQQGLAIADYLIANGVRISYLVTIANDVAIKNRGSGWVSYEDFARQRNIPIYYASTYGLKSDEDVAFFNKHKFDILILGGWQRLLPPPVLDSLKYGALGQHGSSEFLPRGRGRSPLNWSIIKGRKRLVWHLFIVTPGIDDGDIVDYMIFDINEWDTCETLYYKVSVSVKKMLLRTIPKLLSGEILRLKQIGDPSYYPKRTPDDGLIDWNDSVFGVYNLIRAVTRPYPGAFTFDNHARIMIWKAQPWDTHLAYFGAAPGEIVEVFSLSHFVVNCCDGLLLVTESTDTNVYVGKIFSSGKPTPPA